MKFTSARVSALAGVAVLAVSLGAAAACSSAGATPATRARRTTSAYNSGYAFGQAAINQNTSESADLSQDQGAGNHDLSTNLARDQWTAVDLEQPGLPPVPANEVPPQNATAAALQQWADGRATGYGP